MSESNERRVDYIEMGKLISSVEHLTSAVTVLTAKVETLEMKLNTGKGVLLGISLAAAAVGGSVGVAISKLTKIF